jgi:putative SOS response-associated peptidase YedK
MCGRFALYTPPARLARYFEASLDPGVDPDGSPSYNVAPTDAVLGLRTEEDGGSRRLGGYRWGLIASDAPDPSGGGRLFNARAESLLGRPSFRTSYRQRRLVVPADGFFEWDKRQQPSVPHYFTRADGSPMAFAGLWDEWRDPADEDAPAIRSCTIVTTDASTDVAAIHDRMPVVLDRGVLDVWLDPGFDRDELDALLVAPPPGTVRHHPVDRRVGSVQVNEPGLIEERGEEADPGPAQLSLLDDVTRRDAPGVTE